MGTQKGKYGQIQQKYHGYDVDFYHCCHYDMRSAQPCAKAALPPWQEFFCGIMIIQSTKVRACHV
jgi:hypothetical protein